MRCSAMIKHKGDEFYHQCDRQATRFGFCGTHMTQWTPKVPTPPGVPAYHIIRPPARLAAMLIPPARMQKHAWWVKHEVAEAINKCIEQAQRQRENFATSDPLAGYWVCNVCYERKFAGFMLTQPITAAQLRRILQLMQYRTLTDEQRVTISQRMRTHDKMWAWKTIHKLQFHTPIGGVLRNWRTEEAF